MKKSMLLLSLVFLAITAISGGAVLAAPDSQVRTVRDPKTRVVYYLESDRRHIAAIHPDGKLLWCCELFPASDTTTRLLDFGLWKPRDYRPYGRQAEDFILVHLSAGSFETATLDKKTGVFEVEMAR